MKNTTYHEIGGIFVFQYRNGKVQEQQIVFCNVLYHMIKEMSIENLKKGKIPSISRTLKAQQTAL